VREDETRSLGEQAGDHSGQLVPAGHGPVGVGEDDVLGEHARDRRGPALGVRLVEDVVHHALQQFRRGSHAR
jgi:hypothetical protein